MEWLEGKRVLITGGTGSVGKALATHLLTTEKPVREVVIFSRDEQKQYEMAQQLSPKEFPVRYLLGDIRDFDRVVEVSGSVDCLVHSAAMKHVPASEENPGECIKTNLLGSQNVIRASAINRISRVVALSTDKAVLPVNAYGASKLLLEKLFIHAQSSASEGQRFSVVRFGNIFGSKGSVVPFFQKQVADGGVLPVTDKRMTRFSLTMAEAVRMVEFAIEHITGGEIVLPDAPSYRITDIATAVSAVAEVREVGLRSGERMHEPMYSEEESSRVLLRNGYFVVAPECADWDVDSYSSDTGARIVGASCSYSSETNRNWLSVDDIRSLIAGL